MDYEKAYKEALERAKAMIKVAANQDEAIDFANTIFPELKESEDEKIRKALIRFHKSTIDVDGIKGDDVLAWLEKQKVTTSNEDIEKMRNAAIQACQYMVDNFENSTKQYEDAIAWLEKQGEQKPFDYEHANIQQKYFAPQEDIPRYSIGDVLCDKSCTTLNKESQPNFEITDIRNGMYICDKCSFPISQQDEYELVAKRIEQNLADTVEPKFKVGDWIVWQGKCYKVNYNGCGYELVDQDGLSTSLEYGTIDENAHLWTIQDAKDGDVLAADSWFDYPSSFVVIYKKQNEEDFDSYCFVGFDGKFYKGEKGHSTEDIHPATKEQRDLLFQKMHEAGYEWDANTKELKKIEQNPAWSEEDECYMSECIGAIATKDGWSFEEKRKTKHWLESLKERIRR